MIQEESLHQSTLCTLLKMMIILDDPFSLKRIVFVPYFDKCNLDFCLLSDTNTMYPSKEYTNESIKPITRLKCSQHQSSYVYHLWNVLNQLVSLKIVFSYSDHFLFLITISVSGNKFRATLSVPLTNLWANSIASVTELHYCLSDRPHYCLIDRPHYCLIDRPHYCLIDRTTLLPHWQNYTIASLTESHPITTTGKPV